MDNATYEEFFTHPTHTYQRRYEALRAIFVEGRPQKEVAEVFGFAYRTIRQLAYEFRLQCESENPTDASPFFVIFNVGDSQVPVTMPRRPQR